MYISFRLNKSFKFYIISLSCFVMAIFSKEDAASMPFIIIIIEFLFFKGFRNIKSTIAKAFPFIFIIIFYILVYFSAGKYIFSSMLHSGIDSSNTFELRPLYSLLTCWSVFFVSPQGHLSYDSLAYYLTALGLIVSVFWVRNRNMFCLGMAWIFFSFIPQSLTTMGQIDPTYMINSISRYLYITSIGSAIILATIITELKSRINYKWYYAIASLLIIALLVNNYDKVQERGKEWQEKGDKNKQFIFKLKKIIPVLPPKTHIYVDDGPTGRAFMQQLLHVFYKTTDITWINDPNKYIPNNNEIYFIVVCHWEPDGNINLEFH